MTWIEAKTEQSVVVRAKREDALHIIKDICRIGVMFPGVDRVEDRGAGRFRFSLAERSTLGVRFVGEYLNLYEEKGPDTYAFHSLEGNMKVRGFWQVRGPDGSVTITEQIATELEVPVPRLLKGPVQIFADRELSTGVKAQLERIRRALEG